jgi:DNA-binding transcriptional MerR regulator
MDVLKVGQLARRTGLTVRTLHHYDEVGLLSPSGRTRAGYRLYADADVARLQQIVALRQLGFSLEEVHRCLDDPAYSLNHVLRMRISRMREEVEAQHRLCIRLEALADRLEAMEQVSVDDFLETIGAMTMHEKYFTPEQRAQIEQRGAVLGQDHIRAVEAEWPELIAKVRAEMEKGTDPASETVQKLARRWKELVNEFTGGDAGIARSVMTVYQNEPEVRRMSGLDGAIFEYVKRAMKDSNAEN